MQQVVNVILYMVFDGIYGPVAYDDRTYRHDLGDASAFGQSLILSNGLKNPVRKLGLDGKLVARVKSGLPFLPNLDHFPTELMADDHRVLSDV